MESARLTPAVVFAHVQEQEPVLRVGQQRRVQLECKGSQGHVQVWPRNRKKKRFWEEPNEIRSHMIRRIATQVHDDDGVRPRCCH